MGALAQCQLHEEKEKKNRDLLPFPDVSESEDRHYGT